MSGVLEVDGVAAFKWIPDWGSGTAREGVVESGSELNKEERCR